MASAASLVSLWTRLRGWPGGTWLFSRIVGWAIPYTGSMRAHVLEVEPGHARVRLQERRRVRNHLNSIHAIALTNVGEFTGGLAMTAALPADVRSILLRLEIDFLKKARGTVEAVSTCAPPVVREPVDYVVTTNVRNGEGEEVARITATWRLSAYRAEPPA